MLVNTIHNVSFPAIPEHNTNQRHNHKKVDPTAHFAPWETEESFDCTTPDYNDLMGLNIAQNRPQTVHLKTSSFPSLLPEVEATTQQNFHKGSQGNLITSNNKSEYKKEHYSSSKRLANTQESPLKQQKGPPLRSFQSNRVQTESDYNSTPAPHVIFNNSVRYSEKQTQKKVMNPRPEKQESVSPFRLTQRHNSEQLKDLNGSPFQEHGTGHAGRLGKQITNIFQKKGSFAAGLRTYESRENNNYMESIMKEREVLGNYKYPGTIDLNEESVDPPSPTYIYIEGDIEDEIRKLSSPELYYGSNKTFDAHRAREIKLKIPKQTFTDGQSVDRGCENSVSIKTTHGVDMIKKNDEVRAMRARILKEFLPPQVSSATFAPNQLKRVQIFTANGNPKGVMDMNSRIDKKKNDSPRAINNKSAIYANQSVRPIGDKEPVVIKQEQTLRNNYMPSMMDCYRGNKKKYWTKPMQNNSFHDMQRNEELREQYNSSQIPLLGNLKKMFDLKAKTGAASNVSNVSNVSNANNARGKEPTKVMVRQIENPTPSPERVIKGFMNKPVKMKDMPYYEKDSGNIRGKLENSLKEKMVSLSGVSAIKMDINEDRNMNQRKANRSPILKGPSAPYTVYGSRTGSLPNTGTNGVIKGNNS